MNSSCYHVLPSGTAEEREYNSSIRNYSILGIPYPPFFLCLLLTCFTNLLLNLCPKLVIWGGFPERRESFWTSLQTAFTGRPRITLVYRSSWSHVWTNYCPGRAVARYVQDYLLRLDQSLCLVKRVLRPYAIYTLLGWTLRSCSSAELGRVVRWRNHQ